MATCPFTVTPTASLRLEAGQEGKLSFSVTSLAAPDEVHEVILRALRMDGDGKGREVDWLVAGPARTLRIAGGKTETVTVTARPTSTSPRGESTIKLAIADEGRPDPLYAESPAVVCEVIAPPAVASPSVTKPRHGRLPRWSIPAILGGLLLVSGALLLGWKLAGEGSRPPAALPALGQPTTKPPVVKSTGGTCSPNRGKACNCGGTVQCDGACSTAACAGTCTNGRCCVFSTDPACGHEPLPVRNQDFNGYILKAIDLLLARYRGLGYSINTAYTHDLDYSQPHEIKAGPGVPATMCVAAVSEVIIVALKLYADEQGDRSVFARLPARSWVKGTPMDIRPYMFLYDSVESRGTADALKHFGIGEHMPFPALVPGDFIGLNRDNRTGHAVVFLGFLNASGQIEPRYDSRTVVGFKYFSAQGQHPPSAGFGYRWAFFGKCPSWYEPNKPRDCGIIPSNDQALLNTGYMLHPTRWITTPAMLALRTTLIQRHTVTLLARRLGRAPTSMDLSRLSAVESRQLEDQANREISKELPPSSRLKFDGATTDD